MYGTLAVQPIYFSIHTTLYNNDYLAKELVFPYIRDSAKYSDPNILKR